MTPARLSLITRLATNLATARAQHRGRTVPAIREGGPWDGRATVPFSDLDQADQDSLWADIIKKEQQQ